MSRQSSSADARLPRFRPVAPSDVVAQIAQHLEGLRHTGRAMRVAVDGAPIARPGQLGDDIGVHLRAAGRAPIRLNADDFLRNASVRLEYGRTDVTSRLHGWLDIDALRREVLDPLGDGGDGCYLPTLRDPITNRATRAARVQAPDDAIVLLSGSFLIGELDFDALVHLNVAPGALGRRIDEPDRWLLPAFAEYEREVDPVAVADVVVRLDDPKHPAISIRPR